ncbi:hypothetical protein KEM55_006075, partial [Ascosphaera atra]
MLGRFLDRPSIPWKSLIVGFSLGQFALESYLSWRQYKCLCGKKPPKALQGEVSQEKFDRSQEYGREKTRFVFIADIYEKIYSLSFIKYDVLPKLWSVAGHIVSSYMPTFLSGEIGQSLVFLFIQNVSSVIMNLPVSYYNNFVLEEKYGFNKLTPGLWVSDMLKGQALGVVIGGPILAGILKIVKSSGPNFFYYLWLFVVGVQVA